MTDYNGGHSRHEDASTPVVVLLIEDNPGDALLIEEKIGAWDHFPCEVVVASTLADGLRRLAADGVQVVLLDLNLPDSDGLQTFHTVVEANGTVPVIVLTGLEDEELAVQAVGAGAQDYLVKNDVTARELVRALRHTLERHRLITEVKHARRREVLAREIQLQMKDQFLSRVSHELKTPLAAAHQFIGLVRDGVAGDLSEDQARYLEIALNNAEQLDRMISDLLDLTRAANGQFSFEPERLNVESLVTEVAEGFRGAAEAKGVALELDVGELPPIYADPTRLRQVVSNLLDNAIKFTEDGRLVTVAAEASVDEVTVAVTDEGLGIPPDQLSKVFLPLHQAHLGATGSRSGLGLGLTICQDIVRLHGGRITVESEVGEGSTFFLTLPMGGAEHQRTGGADDGGVTDPAAEVSHATL